MGSCATVPIVVTKRTVPQLITPAIDVTICKLDAAQVEPPRAAPTNGFIQTSNSQSHERATAGRPLRMLAVDTIAAATHAETGTKTTQTTSSAAVTMSTLGTVPNDLPRRGC